MTLQYSMEIVVFCELVPNQQKLCIKSLEIGVEKIVLNKKNDILNWYYLSLSAHWTPNFKNHEYVVCLLFEYFFQIKVLSWYQNIPKNANKTRHIKKKKPLNNTLNGEIEIRVFDGLNEIGQRVLSG